MCESFGQRVKDLRTKRQSENKQYWSLQALASRIGISAQALSLIENGKTQNPNMDIIKKLAIEFNVTTDYLIFGNNKQTRELILEIPSDYNINIKNVKIILKDK
ncbi:MAG: transcriptional regulator, family [Caloramator sp.]|uniref:helix-turn-helix domain-containing protein n=1 Tax=Caloramator sp. TaxID=1871330 RepID=UPI001D6B387D|nr:helix-turn-helix transcriptional regulator [Caloramator sp.]MBZ4662724.1 transcriptional regulator, family [Caloramator sp.]